MRTGLKQSLVAIMGLMLLLMVVMLTKAVFNLEYDSARKGAEQTENAVRRTAVACYALEGHYPDSIEYMEQHYGLNINHDNYVVVYEIFAENIMPEITVLEK